MLALARQEAERLNHNFVGTEHLLLGLIKLGQGTAVSVLQKLGLNLETLRDEVKKHVGTGPGQNQINHIPYTPRVKKVLSFAAKEAIALKHTYVGTEHILLGLLREGDGVAGRVLKSLNVDIEKTRLGILKELDPNISPTDSNLRLSANTEGITMSTPDSHSIDITKRYDIYCAEMGQQIVVYRNAMFKGKRKLASTREHDFPAEYIEVEQSNGQTIFLSRHSAFKFCETGVESTAEIVGNKK